jgi:hypothetical protein
MGGCALNIVTLVFTSTEGYPRVNWCFKNISSMVCSYVHRYESSSAYLLLCSLFPLFVFTLRSIVTCCDRLRLPFQGRRVSCPEYCYFGFHLHRGLSQGELVFQEHFQYGVFIHPHIRIIVCIPVVMFVVSSIRIYSSQHRDLL